MNHLKSILCFITLSVSVCSAQNWRTQFSGSGNQLAKGITIDQGGNVVSTGIFSDVLEVDTGGGSVQFTSTGSYDIFIHKSDANGNFTWIKTLGGPGLEEVFGIEAGIDGSIYIAGAYSDSANFYTDSSAFFRSRGESDAFVLKLDSAGSFVWVKTFGGIQTDRILAMTINSFENIFITGYVEANVDLDPGAGSYSYTVAGNSDIFVESFDSAGNFRWASGFGSALDDRALGVTHYNSNVYFTGVFHDSIDFDPSANLNVKNSVGGRDMFILAFDDSGNYGWARSFGGPGEDFSNSIATDAYGEIIAGGHFESIADFDPSPGTYNLVSQGQDDIFIQKLDTAGNFVWAKSYGGQGDDEIKTLSCHGTDIYFAGTYQDSIEFTPGVI